MFNPMPEWPEWMNEPHVLTPEGEDKVIELLADMARLTKNSDIKIDYWEIFNERDNKYEDGGALDKYFALYNRAYDTIKTVLPDAKIGGLAFTHPKYEWISGFLDQCAGKYDFISWHNYSNGSDNRPNDSVMVVGRPSAIVNGAQGVVNQLKVRGLENDVETFLTEYNIQWTWDPIEERHANHIGAMFQAAVVSRLAELGLSGIALWHNKGNAYGLINNNNEMRATGILYSWGTRYLAGDRAAIVTGPSRDKLEVIPVLNHTNDSSVLLLNKSSLETKIPFNSLSISGSKRILTLDHHSYYPYPIHVVDDTLTLPPMAATLVTTQPAAENMPPSKPEISGFSQLNSITINISNLKDETSFAGYKLFINDQMYGFFSNLTSMTIQGLEQGTAYDFKAVSTDEEGNVSDTSDLLTITTKVDATAPTIPSRLKSEVIDQSHVKFSWNPSLDNSGISGYVVLINDQVLDTISETEYVLDFNGYTNELIFEVYAFDPHGNNSEKASADFVVSVKELSVNEKIILFPNPVNKDSEFFIKSESSYLQKQNISLFDQLGSEIPVQVDRIDERCLKVIISNSQIRSGYYFIQINKGNYSTTNKLLIN
jgi:hypothetical protein